MVEGIRDLEGYILFTEISAQQNILRKRQNKIILVGMLFSQSAFPQHKLLCIISTCIDWK